MKSENTIIGQVKFEGNLKMSRSPAQSRINCESG